MKTAYVLVSRSFRGLAALVITFSLASSALAAGYNFQVIDPGGTFSSADGINRAGQIVGSGNGLFCWLYPYSGIDPYTGTSDGFYRFGPPTPGMQYCLARGINRSGQIVGGERSNTSSTSGFLRNTDGLFTGINFPCSASASAYTFPLGINDAGQIVGVACEGFGFLLSGGSYSMVLQPNGNSLNEADGINNLGQIVGFYTDTAERGFLLAGSTFVTIDYPGAVGTHATGINKQGDVVGYYWTDGSRNYHGFVVKGLLKGKLRFTSIDFPGPARLTPLPSDPPCQFVNFTTQASGINDFGDVVGTVTESYDNACGVVGSYGFLATRGH